MNKIFRLLAAIAFLALIAFLFKGWMKVSTKEERGDPKALKISMVVRDPGPDETPDSATPVTLQFTNLSEQTIKVMKPQPGSQLALSQPYYVLEMSDPLGNRILPDPHSKMAEPSDSPKWPDDYVVELPPGQSFVTNIGFYRPLALSGRYRMQFGYTYDPELKGPKGDSLGINYPRGLWIGTASSDIQVVDLSRWVGATKSDN